MQLMRFTEAGAFARRAEPYLLEREAVHNLQLGLCSTLVSDPTRYADPLMALVEQEGEVLAVALRTPPFNLVLSEVRRPEAISLLVRELRGAGLELPGVLGPAAVSRSFAAQWQALAGQPNQPSMSMRIYQLDQVSPVGGVPGQLRMASAEDRDLLATWATDFNAEVFPHRPASDGGPLVDRLLAARDQGIYLWLDPAPVAMAAYTGPTPHGIRVALVYTPPDQRRRGYASALVAGMSQRMLDEGRRFCFLFTDLANPTSNHIYQEIGYQPVADYEEYRF